MIQYFLWGVSLLGLFIAIFWSQVALMPEHLKNAVLKHAPKVSFIIPAWNEEKTISRTVRSLLALDYPKNKIQVIVVNDGSTDRTADVVNRLIKENKSFEIILAARERTPGQFTKAPALNYGLKYATGEFVGCLDSDSTVEKDVLKHMLPYFQEKEVGAVITAIKVSNTGNIWGKIQRIEYILATFIRQLMSKVDTLHITPGALSIYRTDVINKLGGFDETNITEDYEIAMRLKYNGYSIKISSDAVSHTKVPDTFWSLWNQRVRWFRGFITTMSKYKNMLGNKTFGMMGVFQYPLNLISFLTVLVCFGLSTYVLGSNLYHTLSKIIVLRVGILEIMHLPSIKDTLLSIDLTVVFPIIVSFAVGIYIYHLAHKHMKEKWMHPFALFAYFLLYPPLKTMHWITAVYKETFRRQNKWR